MIVLSLKKQGAHRLSIHFDLGITVRIKRSRQIEPFYTILVIKKATLVLSLGAWGKK